MTVVEALDDHLRNSGELGAVGARGEDDPDRLGVEAPSDKRQHLCRRAVEPLLVVDEQHQGPLVGEIGNGTEYAPYQPGKDLVAAPRPARRTA